MDDRAATTAVTAQHIAEVKTRLKLTANRLIAIPADMRSADVAILCSAHAQDYSDRIALLAYAEELERAR